MRDRALKKSIWCTRLLRATWRRCTPLKTHRGPRKRMTFSPTPTTSTATGPAISHRGQPSNTWSAWATTFCRCLLFKLKIPVKIKKFECRSASNWASWPISNRSAGRIWVRWGRRWASCSTTTQSPALKSSTWLRTTHSDCTMRWSTVTTQQKELWSKSNN